MDLENEKKETGESGEANATKKKPSFFALIKASFKKFKDKVRFKIKLNIAKLSPQHKKKKDQSENGDEEADDKASSKKKKKEKPVKKKKGSKGKSKNKGKDNKNKEDSGEEDSGETGKASADDKGDKASDEKSSKKGKKSKKKRKDDDDSSGGINPLLIAALLIGAMGIGGVATALVMFNMQQNTPPALLLKANAYMQEENYTEAQKTYEKIISKKDDKVDTEILADAYLGVSNIQMLDNARDKTIVTLQEGFDRTGDERLSARLAEINAQIEKERLEAEQKAGNTSAKPVVPDVPVVWKNHALEKMVLLALGKSASDTVMESELSSITSLKIVGATHAAVDKDIDSFNSTSGYSIGLGGEIYTEHGEITSLEDIAYFKGLKKLTISYNKVSDIRDIEKLASLETLGLYFNEVSDIRPLSSLSNLKNLFLFNNQIVDISPLAGLRSLNDLWLQNNQIESIAPVSGLTDLTQLFINGNQVTDISMLSPLTKLRFLYANDNQISDISVVADMPSLTDISFVGNPVTSYAPASNINNVNQSYSSPLR